MEITEEQYVRIKDSLPVQRGNVSLSNLQFLNAVLYVAEHVESAWVTDSAVHWPNTPADENPADVWYMPGEVAGSFELRRITTRWTRSRTASDAKGPRIDLKSSIGPVSPEKSITVQEVYDWLAILLFR